MSKITNDKAGDDFETKIAKRFGFRKQPNSGATKFKKGDLVNDNFLLDCKTCVEDKKSVTIKEEWITKIKSEALSQGKLFSGICFSFGQNKEPYFIVDGKLFTYLLDYIRLERIDK